MALDDILVTVGADISNYIDGLNRAAEATQKFEGNLKASSNAVRTQTSAITGQASAVKSAGDAQAGLASDVRSSSDAVKRQGVDLAAADAAYEGYINEVQEAEIANQNMAAGALATSGVVLRATAVVAGAITALIVVASDFESAFIGVEKTVEGTPEQFERLAHEIRGLSKEMPQSASAIAGVAEEAGRLGIKREDIAEFSKTMIMMGDTTDMSASQAAQSMARLMNIMGTSEEDVERLGSTITHMGNNAAASESEILELSRRLAGAAQQVGLTESEVVAMSGSMAELGIRAEAGGTAMQKTILTMNTAVMEGGEELDTFAKTAGMTSDEFKQAFEQDAMQAIIAFISGLDDVSQSGGDVASVLGEVGLSNERTMDTLLRLSSSHEKLAGNMDLTAGAWADGTALADEAEKRYQSLVSVLSILLNRVMDVVRTIGGPFMNAFKILLTAIEPVLTGIEVFVGLIDKLPSGVKTTAAAVVILTTGLTALLAAMAAVNAGWKLYAAQAGITTAITFSMAGAKLAAATAVGVLSSAIKFALGPLGLIIAAAGALVAGLTWLVGWITSASDAEKEFAEETENLTDSTESLNDSIGESRKAHADNLNNLEASSRVHNELADEVVALSDAENLSASNKAELNAKVGELNGSIEGLNLAYDEQTGKLNMSKEALQDRLDLMENESKLTASQERMTEIAEERNKADMKLEEINKHREELNALTEEQGYVSSDTRDKLSELTEQEELLTESHEELGNQYEIVSNMMVDAQEKVDQAVAEGVLNQTLSYKELSEEQRESIDELISKYDEMQSAAVNMFDKISDTAEHSAEEMRDTLEHNINSFEQWEENLDILAEEGATHLLKHFKELGPEHSAELQEIVDADGDIMEEMERMIEESSRGAAESLLDEFDIADEAKEVLTNIIIEGGDAYEQELLAQGLDEFTANHMDEITAAIEGKESNFRTSTELLIDAGVKDPFIEALRSGDLEGYGEDTVQGFADGVDSNGGEAKSAIDKVMEEVHDSPPSILKINSPSKVFFDYGSDTLQGFIDGLDNLTGGLLSKVGGIFSDMLGKTDEGLGDVSSRSDQGVSDLDRIFGLMPGNTNRSMVSMYNKMKAQGANQASFMSRMPNRLTSPFNSLTRSLTSVGSNAMGGLRSGLTGMIGSVMATARSIASRVASTMKGALKVKSPSRVTMGIGSDTTEGLVIGLGDKIKDVTAVSKRMAEAAKPDDIRLGAIDYDYKAQSRRFNSFDGAVKGSVDVNSKDELLVNALRGLREDMRNLRVEMDGRVVGEITEPHVTSKQNRKNNPRRNKRRGGR